MAVIFNKTKCEDCIHGAICVKKNDFNDLVKQINGANITVVAHDNKSIGIAPINNGRFSAHVYIECDYFIKKHEYSTPRHGGVLLCKKNIEEEQK